MSNPESFVGIDVAKAWLDLAWLSGQTLRLDHSDEAIAGLVERLRSQPPTLVVMEATGGMETDVASALAAAGLPVAVVNPRQVRDYAKACGRLAKTDRIDVMVLAAFAAAIRPQVRALPDEDTRALGDRWHVVDAKLRALDRLATRPWGQRTLTSSPLLPMICRMRYPGGKGKCYQHVINLMPPHRVYIETHLGGGAVLLHKRASQRTIAIELDSKVIEAWRSQAQQMGIELVQGKAEDFLRAYPFEGDELLYVDPPYHPDTRRRRRVYTHDYAPADHEQLLALLSKLPCKVMLSGYANSLYERMLPKWHRHDFLAKTHHGCRTESLWLNFEAPDVLHDPRYLGGNFREREVAKRRLSRLQDRLQRMDPKERAAIARWLYESYPETLRSRA